MFDRMPGNFTSSIALDDVVGYREVVKVGADFPFPSETSQIMVCGQLLVMLFSLLLHS